MKDELINNWDAIMRILGETYGITDIIINTWIKPLIVCDVRGKTVYLAVEQDRGAFSITFLKNKGYDTCILSAIREFFGDASIEMKIDMQNNILTMLDEDSTDVVDDKVYEARVRMMGINPNYTFENFVVGESNKMAYVTCTAVADLPGQDHFNPLFLYGDSGIGKTHLIQAIAHFILLNHPDLKVLYVSADTFINDIIAGLQEKNMKDVKERYRNVDVLIIDDIQQIIGKEATQQEFFNTFNHLHSLKKQIILSSDKPPGEMKTLEDRLKSRFEWGIPIDMHAPDYETRVAILHSKAELINLKGIPEEVFAYMAENIATNVRELEGALSKIRIYRQLGNQDISVEMVQSILKDIISKDGKAVITADTIINVVAEHMGVTVADIKSPKRSKDIVMARQMAMYLCRNLTDKALEAVGEVLGGRTHATVLNGIKRP